ncbi:MAG: SufE family protein [Nocardioides sp.]
MTALPGRVQAIVDDFAELPPGQRLELLLEFSRDLPELPAEYAQHPELLEPVPECQSPIFVAIALDSAAGPTTPDPIVRLHFSAPAEAPTTRGFAGILHEGLDGLSASAVLDIPPDLPHLLSLTEQVSPLRLRGMTGMLARIKAQVRRQLDARNISKFN